MPFFRRDKVSRQRDGSFRLDLEDWERALLRSLPGQLRQSIEDAPGDPWLRRLFPVAYPGDREAEEEYRRMVGDDLVERRTAQLDALAAAADASSLSQDDLVAAMQAVNDLRLYLGTRLDLSEETDADDFEPDSPDAALYELYSWLSYLQSHMVEAL